MARARRPCVRRRGRWRPLPPFSWPRPWPWRRPPSGEAQFRDTIHDILADVMGTDLPPDRLHALQNCSINAFSALTPDQKQGLVDAGRANGDQ